MKPELHNLLVQAGLKRLVDAYWIKMTTSRKMFKKSDEITRQISKAKTHDILEAAYDVIERHRTENQVCGLKRLKFKEIRDDVASEHRMHPAVMLETRTKACQRVREELFVRCYYRGIYQRDIELMTRINRANVRAVFVKYGFPTTNQKTA